MSTTNRGRPIGTLTVALLQKLADAPEPLSRHQLCGALADVAKATGVLKALDRERDNGCIQASRSAKQHSHGGNLLLLFSLTAAGYRKLKDAKAADPPGKVAVTPEYLELLANVVDPDQLWKRPMFDRNHLPESQRHQLDAGVALRRYAADVRALRSAASQGKSLLLTTFPHALHTRCTAVVDTPASHQRVGIRMPVRESET